MIVRKLAILIGALVLFLSFGSCKNDSTRAKCCTFTAYGYTYLGCEGGDLYVNGYNYGPILPAYWSYFVNMTYYYGGSCG